MQAGIERMDYIRVLWFFIISFSLHGLIIKSGFSQSIQINEIQSSNVSTIYDHTDNTPDWIEIYNNSSQDVNLENYGLTDNDTIPFKWIFPSTIIAPYSHLLVYASGLDLKEPSLYWETIIDLGDEWRYIVPDSDNNGDWRLAGFNDDNWLSGKSSFGYGDGDDTTVIENVLSVYLRKSFELSDVQNVRQAYLHIDFDDAFVAFINGHEIARSNIGQEGLTPTYDTPADNYNHEAVMYQGGQPEKYLIANISDYLHVGENILSIQLHNHSTTSSDLSLIPFLSLGYETKPAQTINTSYYIKLVPIGLHTNFKISSDGEPILLSDPSGVRLDSIYSGNLSADISMGRYPDGGEIWSFYSEPTPGDSNSTQGFKSEILSIVQFSEQGGIYTSGKTLQLSTSDQNDSIFYTLDGSEPGESDILYTSPIIINSSAVVRSRVMKDGYLPGPIATNTYVIGINHDLPVVCVNTDPYNLWDYNDGIYVMGPNAESDFPHHGANFWQDWERSANISMYEQDGSLAFQIDAGIKIFGAYSRGQEQKSISIHTRKSYGFDGIYYQVFPDKDLSEFKTLILRNSGNDFNNTMIRDALCNRIVASRNIDQQAYRPAVVYLNGEYWGIHNIREKVNEEFIASNHTIDEDLIDIVEGNSWAVRGSADHYEAMLDFISSNSLTDESNYNYVRTQMDIPNYIQYQVAEIFIDNRDWPGNNIKYWRERNETGRWRWIMFDSDFGLNTWDNNNQAFNTLQFALEPNGPGWPNPPWSTFLFRQLMQNVSFKNDFINTFADNLNTIFDPAVMNTHLDYLVDGIDNEINDHLNRWNGNIGYWNDRISAMRSFINERRNNVRNHINTTLGLSGLYNLSVSVVGEGEIKLNTLHLDTFPWDGMYYKNIPIQMEAIPDPGFRFVEWRGIENKNKGIVKISSSQSLNVTAVFEPIDGESSSIVINEINYNSADYWDTGDWIEILNAGDYSVNISGWILKDDDSHEFIIPEGTVIHANGFIVICRNIDKFQVKYPLVETINQELNFGLGIDGDCVRLFDELGNLKDEVCYETKTPWPESANGLGNTLSLIDANSNNESPGNWETSQNHGTPGQSNTDVITSIPEYPLLDYPSIRIYPNPTKANLSIELISERPDFLYIQIMDLTGRKLGNGFNKNLNPGKNKIEISLKDSNNFISPGVYVLHLQSENFEKQLRVVLN